MIITVIFSYLVLVLVIGVLSHKLFRSTSEDYFVASRSIGPFLLLMSLFGTNMTAFAILGASGEAYREGIGVFALLASSSALIIPSVFFFIGTRLWAFGKRFGYLTQVQFFRDRWDSDKLGLFLFIVLVALVIPYLLIGVMGGGITLSQITNDQIPAWVGGLMVCLVVMMYVTYSGARGTAWVNTFQTIVFMTLGAVSFFVIINKLGGLSGAIDSISESNPDLLVQAEHIKPLKLLTYTFIPMSTAMFPHLFMHFLTAKRAETFRYPIMFYPICMLIVWIPSVLLGIFGNIDFPGLQGAEGNSVLIKMVAFYAPGVLGGLLAAGVFAAIMSSLDSQSLALGTMFTQDIVKHYGFHEKMSEKQQVLFGRAFVFIILGITYILSLVMERSIFRLAVWSFTGFASLLPVVVAAIFWKRSTKVGALASITSVVVLWIYFFSKGWQNPGYTIGDIGIMPVGVMLVVSAAAMVVGSLLTRPPEDDVIHRFFPKSN